MLALVLMLADAPGLVAEARARLAVERPCIVDPDSTDITVCGMRHADRFRVPLVEFDPGNPRQEGVRAERSRLLARTNPIRELSPFLVGGGLAGVTVTVAGDGRSGATGYRKLAP